MTLGLETVIFRFDQFTLDTDRLELQCGDQRIDVEPQVFSVLSHLICNREHVVSKDALIEAVWDGRAISDSTLNTRINAVRRAVGDSGKAQSVIRTFPRRGFRFVAEVVEEGEVSRQGSRSDAMVSIAGTRPEDIDLSGKPSIAVLPFDNMSGDPEQEYFADGITEDIITDLSRFSEIMVIARNSTFTFKGRSVLLQDVGRELGARYVVDGSVRRANDRVRINLQLSDAANGSHIWAERYDRVFEDIFDLQDEVSRTIVATLPGRVELADIERVKRQPPENMATYDFLIRAKDHYYRTTEEDNAAGLQAVHKAIELDPHYGHAHAWLSCLLGQAWSRGWDKASAGREHLVSEQAAKAVDTAYALDENDSESHRILANINLLHKDLEKARYHQERALALNPNDDRIVALKGLLLTRLGHGEEGAEWIEQAMRLNPYHLERYWNHLGCAHFVARHYEQSIDAFKHLGALSYSCHAFLAACHAQLEQSVEAEVQAKTVMNLRPGFSTTAYIDTLTYAQHADREHHRDALRKAGLPD